MKQLPQKVLSDLVVREGKVVMARADYAMSCVEHPKDQYDVLSGLTLILMTHLTAVMETLARADERLSSQPQAERTEAVHSRFMELCERAVRDSVIAADRWQQARARH